ncbi:MAG: tRNA (adenosine(37)-N6)-dimethylallyltransferase MiaA [Bacteroidota bacterium]
MQKKVILITGPTAVGKTALAIEIARQFQTEIISADSRQCYSELNIGVARPTKEELAKVPHHFIASHRIEDTITAAYFEQFALGITDDIFRRKDVLVMAGGTGLYVKAFTEGLDEIPAVDPGLRNRMVAGYEMKGIEWLQGEIKRMDPEYASRGSMQNPQRMLRALEVMIGTGHSILSFQLKNKKQRPFSLIHIRLDLPRAELYTRINNRVDQMIQMGLSKEVESLYSFRHFNALQTVGYKELFDYMEGNCNLDEAVESIKRNTRHFAKRQCTWFAHQLPSEVFHPEDLQKISEYIHSEFTSDRH